MKAKELLEWSIENCKNECNECEKKKECDVLRKKADVVYLNLAFVAKTYNSVSEYLDYELDENKIEMLEHAKDIRDCCMSRTVTCKGCVFYQDGNGCLFRSTPDSWDI